MIRDFIAIDFETANQQPSSVCSVGVVMVRNGQVADSFYSLIQPEPNYYNYWCQRVHGLSQCDTDDAPVFSKVWQQLEEKIADVFFSDQQTIDDLRYQIATICFSVAPTRLQRSRNLLSVVGSLCGPQCPLR